jgi:hypothetical protein
MSSRMERSSLVVHSFVNIGISIQEDADYSNAAILSRKKKRRCSTFFLCVDISSVS